MSRVGSRIEFMVNGKKCFVDSSLPRDTTLNTYLRRVLALPGTKYMCKEGGCGACIVMVKAKCHTSGTFKVSSVNSCLVLVFSCHGWEITTIEKVGNRLDEYSEVQKRIVAFNATQCGYCTPAWVMSITSLLNKNLTMAELERSFGSNTCRCTGYRSLLDAIKSFAIDASPQLCQKVKDIEDLYICEKTKKPCKGGCDMSPTTTEDDDWVLLNEEVTPNTISLHFGNNKYFYKVFNISDIFDIINTTGKISYMLAHGNTAKGIYPILEYQRVVIDISDVTSLKTFYFDQNFVIGANTSIEESISLFKDVAKTKEEFSYLTKFAEHLLLVAHIPVRNIGTLVGNLMIKHKHPAFKSDIFLMLECVAATVTVRNRLEKKSLTLTQFLNFDMNGWLMTNIKLPPLSSSHYLRSYKITPRNQNSLAIVHAAFCVQIKDKKVIKASLVIGNISSTFIHATQTEKFIQNKNIFDNNVLESAIKVLHAEVQPEHIPGEPDPSTRRKLAIGLFYKFVISIAPVSIVKPEFRSGGKMLERPVSAGTQDFETNNELYPLNQPLQKLEAVIQTSGEANYVNDLPPIKNEVFAAFVLSTVFSGEIDTIDATEVLTQKGVIAVYTAKDIPGKNSFIKPGLPFCLADEELLVDKKIAYYGQPIAIMVAESEHLAEIMAKKVKVTYKNVSTKPPVLTIDAAKKDPSRIIPSESNITPTRRGTDVKKVVKGVFSTEGQYHYYMEPLSCVVVPVDNGLEVYPSTQFNELDQLAVAELLNIKDSEVFVKNRRVGGAFGGKITRCARVSTACALVAKKLDLPCRMIMPLETSMLANGKRYPCQFEYEVGVDDNGKIQYLEATAIGDSGNSINENNVIILIASTFPNCYDKSVFSLKTSTVLTDTPCTINTRAPGTVEALTTMEYIIEHIAFEVKKDPTDVRMANMRTDDNDIPELIDTLKEMADFDKRAEEIKQYNKANRWMKKGIQINVMNFPISYLNSYSTMISIYRGDGSVTITSGGVEMGQGLNTKVAQVVAYELKIPVQKVSVLPVFSFVAPQNMISGGSVTSACISYAAIKACEQLNERLAPVKAENPDASWEEVVFAAASKEIDLTSRYTINSTEFPTYNCFAVAISETILDVLTGRFNIERVDILEDVGTPVNPNLDIGQIEGAYIQGIGYLTCEKLIYDQLTGKLLTNRSLNYHVPLCTDIPIKTNIHLRKNSYNKNGILGAKAVGEMGICLANGILHGLRYAIQDSRNDSGYDPNLWINIDVPYTTDSILTALDVKPEELKLY